jgi:hypothetical protein
MSADSVAFQCAVQSLDEQIDRSGEIVVAWLVAAKIVDDKFSTATFEVNDRLKGISPDRLELKTRNDAGMTSGVPLVIGRIYILFILPNSDGISVCGGSTFYSMEKVSAIKKILRAN